MKYMLLIHSNHDAWAGLSDDEGKAIMDEYYAFTQRLADSGELVSGDPLQGPETATTVRVRDGKRSTTDGPFVETKEHLAGYYVVDCADLDRALELAEQIPDARFSGVEVRPVGEM